MSKSLKNFKFRLSHDGGQALISIPARNFNAAYRNLLKAENCPESAIQPLNKGS